MADFSAGGGSCAKIAVLKVPRTGSTWLAKELRAFGAGVQLEFEPFTDPSAHVCAGRFYTQALGKALGQRLRCVTRESKTLPCYWGWLGCNHTRLKPRPVPRQSNASGSSSSSSIAMSSPAHGSLLSGFLINPMYAPGAIWNRVLAAQPRAKLVWLRRTNLVKMALSDLRRLASASLRQIKGKHAAGAAQFVEPRTLLTRLNMTLVTQATFPAAISLDRGLLVLYEDLQSQRLLVLRGLLRFLGLDSVGHVVDELKRQDEEEATKGTSISQTTHWQKASEDVCEGLPKGNCDKLREGLQGKPCLLAQLQSTTARPFTFPNFNGTLSLAELDGECAELPPLAAESAPAKADECPHARRTLYELYGTRLPPLRCESGALPQMQIAKKYVLPYSLSREESSSSVSSFSSGGGTTSGNVMAAAGAAQQSPPASKERTGRSARKPSAVAAPHMVRPWQRMVNGAGEGGGGSGRGSVRFVIFSRQRSASTTFVGLLNLHPNITCRWESFSNSFTASKMRNFLNIPNRSDQLSNIPRFMRRFWRACPTRACGFKLLNAQIRPVDKVKQVFYTSTTDAGDEGEAAAEPSAVPVRRILLERGDIAAEFDSWRRAQSTGNWGTNPEAQASFGKANTTARLSFRGCRGCDPEAVAKNQAMANSIGPARFAFQHRAWFRAAYDVEPSAPLLHIYSENLTSSLATCNRTMAAVYRFLELPPLSDGCNISAIPTEWPCDIQNDKNCSMEKFAAHAD